MILKSRNGDTWYLQETTGGYLWKLPDFTRVGTFQDSQGGISFVDPPGGPYIGVGQDIRPGELVTKILEEPDGGVKIYIYKEG